MTTDLTIDLSLRFTSVLKEKVGKAHNFFKIHLDKMPVVQQTSRQIADESFK
jgi:hypothetical protein